MQLPVVFKPTSTSLPPLHTWPRLAKRAILLLAVLAVLTAYVLLAGGLIAMLAVLADGVN